MEPIAKRLKQSAESALLVGAKAKKNGSANATTAGDGADEEDVAARIKRLEVELQQSSESSSESSSDDDSSASESEESSQPTPGRKRGVVSLSAYAEERVDALPTEFLPPQGSSVSLSTLSKRKHSGVKATSVTSELLDEIQWPKKVPFACKPCGFVGKDMGEFEAHRESPAHLERAGKGQSTLRCVLCDKTFTSPAQLSEHKAGKWHQQRAYKKKERHMVRVCYDFVRGSCRRGDQCAFEHTETKAMKRGRALDKTKRRACQNFARGGTCKFGDQCLFAHSES